jgi:hypothetical protein
MYSARTGQARLGYRPSKKSIKLMVEKVHAMTVRSMAGLIHFCDVAYPSSVVGVWIDCGDPARPLFTLFMSVSPGAGRAIYPGAGGR